MGRGPPSSPYHTGVTPWAGYTQHNVSYVPYISFHMPCHNTHLTTHAGYIVCTQYSVKPWSSAPYVVYRSRYMRPPHRCGVPCCTCTLSKWYTCCLHVPEATHTSCYVHTPPVYLIPCRYHLNVPHSVDHLGCVFIYILHAMYAMHHKHLIVCTHLMPCILHHTYLIS